MNQFTLSPNSACVRRFNIVFTFQSKYEMKWCDGPFDSQYFRVAQFAFIVVVLIFNFNFYLFSFCHFCQFCALFNNDNIFQQKHQPLQDLATMSSRWFLSIFVDRAGSSSVFLELNLVLAILIDKESSWKLLTIRFSFGWHMHAAAIRKHGSVSTKTCDIARHLCECWLRGMKLNRINPIRNYLR